jgi:hypothetical protein
MRQLLMKHATSIIILLLNTPYVQADHIVLQSNSANFAEGQLIENSTTIELQDDENLILLSDGGDVISVEGPFQGAPEGFSPDEFDLKTAFTNLIDNPDNVYATLGSTRSAGIQTPESELRPVWTLSPFATAVQCVPDTAAIEFWRTDTVEDLTLTLQRPGYSGSGELTWDSGESIAKWPEDVPIVDQELYIVRRQGWMENAMIRLVIIPTRITETPESAIGWLAINGCKSQARLLMTDL